MNLLEDRIRKAGILRSGDILIVDSFLNQQMDPDLFVLMAKEWKARFGDRHIDKILTVEASGIGLAIVAAQVFHLPCLFAKKSQSINLDGELYKATAASFTHKNVNTIIVPKKFLHEGDQILLIDDFLANGCALEALISIAEEAGAEICGIGVAVEKAFQPGGQKIRSRGYDLQSLAIVDSMTDNSITFQKNDWLTLEA